MTINQLELFLEASRTLNFTRTAEQFYISQSAVTQQIKNLEDELQVLLFQRSKKRLALTDAGQVFVREAQSLIEHTRDAIERVQAVQKGNAGHLDVGYMASLGTYELPLSLHNFHMKYPGIHLNLRRDTSVNLYRDFQNGKYDVIFNISADQFVYDNAVEIPLKTFGFVVCMPPNHRLATRKIIHPSDLTNEKLIVQNLNIDSTSSKVVLGRAITPELMENVVATENDAAAVAIMVAVGLGIAILPAMEVDYQKNHLAYVPFDTKGFQVSILLCHRKDNVNPAVDLFVTECKPEEAW